MMPARDVDRAVAGRSADRAVSWWSIASRPTTRKVRFVSEHHSTHLLRADWEHARAGRAPRARALIIAARSAALPRVGAVVLSDYAKGVLTPRVIRAMIDAASKAGTPVIVDPKGHDYSRLSRRDRCITPNRKELADADPPAGDDRRRGRRRGGRTRARSSAAQAVLVTRSEEGMMLLRRRRSAPIHVPAYPVKVRDVSGAGDTVAAVAGACCLPASADFEAAMRAANAAAAVVVGKRGTATVSFAELRHRILPAASLAPEDKIVFDWAVLDERLAEWRRHGLRIGFTNGCFDLLHRGHIRLMARGARRLRPARGRAQQRCLGRGGSRARAGRSERARRAPRCSPRSKPSTSSWCSRRTRRSS